MSVNSDGFRLPVVLQAEEGWHSYTDELVHKSERRQIGGSRADSPAAGAAGQGQRMKKETNADQIIFTR
jgi:hypothetical protein